MPASLPFIHSRPNSHSHPELFKISRFERSRFGNWWLHGAGWYERYRWCGRFVIGIYNAGIIGVRNVG